LHAAGHIEDIGGHKTLAELWELGGTGRNAAHYAKLVSGFSTRRQLMAVAGKIANTAADLSEPIEEQIEAAERDIFAIGQSIHGIMTYTAKQVFDEVCDQIDARSTGRLDIGIPTGFTELDSLITGFQESELIVIACRPSVGKTAFSVCLTRNISVIDRLPILFVSVEQSRVELGLRLLIIQSLVHGQKVRKNLLSKTDKDSLMEARRLMNDSPIYFQDWPHRTISNITSEARRLKARNGIRMVIIDYLQLIQSHDKRLARHEQVAEMSRRLKCLAREIKVPVVVLAQVRREVEQHSKEPRLSDLRESGAIEQDADTVIFLHRNKEEADQGICHAIVEKQRNGPTGRAQLFFRKDIMRFENFEIDRGYQQ
jgi:replicative DNA helicase